MTNKALPRTSSGFLPPPPLRINPPGHVVFRGPFHRKSRANVTLQNLSFTEALAFKIKSTAIKGQVAVHPCSGVINPQQSVEIQVTLTPVTIKPGTRPPMHQILIQTVSTEMNSDYGNHVWQRGRKHNSYKFQCVYEEPNEAQNEVQNKAQIAAESIGGGRAKKSVVWCDSVPISRGYVTHLTTWNQHMELETCVDPNQGFIAEKETETSSSKTKEVNPITDEKGPANEWDIVDEPGKHVKESKRLVSNDEWNPEGVLSSHNIDDPWNMVGKGTKTKLSKDEHQCKAQTNENNDQTQWPTSDILENNAWPADEVPETIGWPQYNAAWPNDKNNDNHGGWGEAETKWNNPNLPRAENEWKSGNQGPTVHEGMEYQTPCVVKDSNLDVDRYSQTSGRASVDDPRYAPVNIVYPVGVITESFKLMLLILWVGIILGKWFF